MAKKHPLQNKKRRVIYYRQFLRKADRRENGMIKQLRSYLKGQKGRLLEKVDLSTFKSKALIDDIFDLRLEYSLASSTFLPLLEQYIEASGNDAIALIGVTKPFVITSEIKNWLDNKVDIFSRSINDTTFKKLKSEFKESLENNEGRAELVRRIENTYGNISRKRAKTIARTEVVGVTQKGTFEGYKQVNVGIKIWVATPDGRTRDSHASIDGQEKPIDVPFGNGLMYPGDPSGSPSEIINCRCTI